ncbi:hypothetical protein ABZX85_49725 [Streptomyces sp. NPDC004539]|uniref:hypothetical protein n=1 Tax=Streptomyces sp. NPDC004539 TaxID=3154280 RepID=UPI0033B7A80D
MTTTRPTATAVLTLAACALLLGCSGSVSIGNATPKLSAAKLSGSDGATLGVSVEVTSVEGDQINFDIEADETPSPAPN